MKKYATLCLIFSVLLLVSGCGKGPITPVQFDTYTMKRYTHDKSYQETKDTTNILTPILYESKEVGTGTTNSFLISEIPLQSGLILGEIVDLNVKQLQAKLVNYDGNSPKELNVKCGKVRLTGYMLNFSYDFAKDQKFYNAQYFFGGKESVYVLSFQSIASKDISAMEKSFKTITCK